MSAIEDALKFLVTRVPTTSAKKVYIRAHVQLEKYREMAKVVRGLVEYRDRNTLNFQLEKADDFINAMRNILKELE